MVTPVKGGQVILWIHISASPVLERAASPKKEDKKGGHKKGGQVIL
jgi:hypothetical protein